MADDPVAQIFHIVLLQAQPVIFLIPVPVLQLNDQIYVLGLSDTGYTEQGLDIDDSDAPKLNKVLGDGRCPADQGVFTDSADLNDIVRDQTMAALDQLQSRFRLTDAALAGDQKAHAVNVYQNTVDGNKGRKSYIEPADGFRHKGAGGLPGHQDRDAVTDRALQKNGVRPQVPAEYDGRYIKRHEPLKNILFLLCGHSCHIGMLHQTADLDPVHGEMLKISGQLNRRPVDIRLPDLDAAGVYFRCQILELHFGHELAQSYN